MQQRQLLSLLVAGLVVLFSGILPGQGQDPPAPSTKPLTDWLGRQEVDRKCPENRPAAEALLARVEAALDALNKLEPERQEALRPHLQSQRDDLKAIVEKLGKEFALTERQLGLEKTRLENEISRLQREFETAQSRVLPPLDLNRIDEARLAAAESDWREAEKSAQEAAGRAQLALSGQKSRSDSIQSLEKLISTLEQDSLRLKGELAALKQSGATGLAVEALQESVSAAELSYEYRSRFRRFLEMERTLGIPSLEVQRTKILSDTAKLDEQRAREKHAKLRSAFEEAKRRAREEENARKKRDAETTKLDDLPPGLASLQAAKVDLTKADVAIREIADRWVSTTRKDGSIDSAEKRSLSLQTEQVEASSSEIESRVRFLRADLEGAKRRSALALELKNKLQEDIHRVDELKSEARRFRKGQGDSVAEALARDKILPTEPAAERYRNLGVEAEELAESISATATSFEALRGERIVRLQELESRARSNETRLLQRLRWTRSQGNIKLAVIKQAADDLKGRIQTLGASISQAVDDFKEYISHSGNRNRLIIAGSLVFVLMFLLRWIRRKLPHSYDWLEGRGETGAKGRWRQVLALILRRTAFSFFTALVLVAVPWVVGFEPAVVGLFAILFGAPFLYRLGRVILDILFAPDSKEGGLVPLDNEICRIFHRSGRYILNLAVLFIPLGLLMERSDYASSNPGFTELWWLIFKVLVSALLLFAVFRPQVLRRLIRGEGVVATSVKNWILFGYPIVVSALLFVFVLGSLRYDEAERFFAVLFAQTFGILLIAYVIYRALLRGVLHNRDIDTALNSDNFSTTTDFMAAGRARFLDRTVRLALRVAVFLPTGLVLAGLWNTVNFDWLEKVLWGRDPGVTIRALIKAVIVVTLTVIAMRLVKGFLTFVMAPVLKLEQGVRYTVATLASYAVLTVGMIITLSVLRVEGTQIALVTSALVFGIGFGLQSIVKNFISGLILLIERPVNVGDRVVVGASSGQVEKITLRATTVMTWDGVGIVIPNEHLIGGTLTNHSLGKPRLRTSIALGVGYDSDISKVRDLVIEILKRHGLVLKHPSPDMYFVGFGDSSLDFEARFWTRLETNRLQVASDLRYAIAAAFRKENIEIPFPQRDVNFRFDSEEELDRLARNPRPKPEEEPAAEGADESDVPVDGAAPADDPNRAPKKKKS